MSKDIVKFYWKRDRIFKSTLATFVANNSINTMDWSGKWSELDFLGILDLKWLHFPPTTTVSIFSCMNLQIKWAWKSYKFLI